MSSCYYLFRFAADEAKFDHNFPYMPFGGGPRNCLGSRLALLENKIALIEILQRFNFVRALETQVALGIISAKFIILFLIRFLFNVIPKKMEFTSK